MLNIQEIKTILKENNIAALKSFGQNFLISENVLNKIIETANIRSTDTILEIGPGLGVLTFELAKKADKVIAIEKDRKFFEILKKNLETRGVKNVSLINDDALNFQFSIFNFQSNLNFQFSNYKLIANLPYNIATAVIMKFLQSENPPQQIVVMVQKEVAQRICAAPPKMNKLAIFCQLYSTPKIIAIVPPTAFHPKPKIDSAILQFTPTSKPPSGFEGLSHSVSSRVLFEEIVNAGFSHPRKTMLNNFISSRNSVFREPQNRVSIAITFSKEEISQWLLQNNIQPTQRPETLTIHNWLCLAKTYKTFHNN